MNMKLRIKWLLVFIALILGILGYLSYQLFLVPAMTRLPIPSELPFYSVDYVFYLMAKSPSYISLGSQEIPATDLTNIVLKDLKDIKNAGFGGVKISFNFKLNNYIQDRIALKAAQVGLYPIGMLSGGNYKPKGRVFNEEEMKAWGVLQCGVTVHPKNLRRFFRLLTL